MRKFILIAGLSALFSSSTYANDTEQQDSNGLDLTLHRHMMDDDAQDHHDDHPNQQTRKAKPHKTTHQKAVSKDFNHKKAKKPVDQHNNLLHKKF